MSNAYKWHKLIQRTYKTHKQMENYTNFKKDDKEGKSLQMGKRMPSFVRKR